MIVVPMLALSICAVVPDPVPGLATPTREDARRHVEENWPYYAGLVGRLAGRNGQSPVLLSVADPDCTVENGQAECLVELIVRFGADVHRQSVYMWFRETEGQSGD